MYHLAPSFAAVLIRACLGEEKQRQALRVLQSTPAASPGWFAAICAEIDRR